MKNNINSNQASGGFFGHDIGPYGKAVLQCALDKMSFKKAAKCHKCGCPMNESEDGLEYFCPACMWRVSKSDFDLGF